MIRLFAYTVRDEMETELSSYVLNEHIPDTPFNYRAVYLSTHPDEILTQDDLIHHINGNHFDSRPDNLMKVTAKEHAQIHSKMRRGLA